MPDNIITLLSSIMRKWKQGWRCGNMKKSIGIWSNIMCGFLKGDSYSPVGFCISKIPVCKQLQESKGCCMGKPGKRGVKGTRSLFVDDLKVYQENHKTLKDVNEMIVQASNDTSACYGVAKCAEVAFERGKMVKGEGLQVLNERMRTADPD